MLLLGLIILIAVIMMFFILKFSAKDGIYRYDYPIRSIENYPLHKMRIGPLEYDLQNKSTLTYTHLGYMGNTGNQLFEISATLGIAQRNKCRVVFPSSLKELSIYQMFDLSHLPIEDVQCDDQILEFDNYEEINVPNDGRVYNLEGYRQSYLYFECIKDYLRGLFPLRNISNSLIKSQNHIVIHIRRTDTVNNSYLYDILQVQLNCSFDYYRGAIDRIR